MIDITVYLVFVDTLGEQFADDEEYLRTGTVKGEAARICHHSTIDGNGKGLCQLFESTHLPHNTEHQLTSAGGLGVLDN